MKQHTIKPLLAALLLAGSCAAQAAHFEVVDYLGFAGYGGTAKGANFSDDALDFSQDGDVALFGANSFSDRVSRIDHAYAADASFFKADQRFSMSLSQSLITGDHPNFSAGALVSIPSITLKIVGDGEAIGSNVSVSFAMQTSAFNDYAPNAGSLTMDMAIIGPDGSEYSALFDYSLETAGTDALTFGFNAKVGDQYLLTGNMQSSLSADVLPVLASANGQLSGNFTVTAVPEPESYAMLLAGLGLLGFAARRRNR